MDHEPLLTEPLSVAELTRQRMTSGPLLPAILRLALPAMGMLYLQAAYNFIDRYWVGHLPDGAAAFAGISAGMFIIWGTFALTHLVAVGTGALVARAIGAADFGRARATAAQGMLLSVIVAVVSAAAIIPYTERLFGLMNTAPDVASQGATFVRVMLWGQPLLFLSFVLNSVYQASGDSITPTKFVAATLVINAVLDPLMIYGYLGFPALGVAGAAWATLISRAIWVVGGLYLLLTGNRSMELRPAEFARLEPAVWGRILRIGVPQCLSGLLFSAVYIALARLTAGAGTAALAGLGIGHTAEQLSFFCAMGFNVAAATLVGQNLGAGRPDRAAAAAWIAAGLAVAYNTLVGLAFLTVPGSIVRFFVEDPEVVRLGSSYLIILALSQPFMGLEFVLAGGFSGAGNTVPPMSVQAPLTVARYPLAMLLMALGLGADGIWWAISLTTVAKALCMAGWFGLGRWKRHKVRY